MLSPEVRAASLAASIKCRAAISDFDALVHVAEPLLQPHHSLAVGGEAEMARLDDAGMHRPDRNLVQALAFGRQEFVRRRLRRAGLLVAERMPHVPEAEIEPGPRIGRIHRLRARTDRGSRAPAGLRADGRADAMDNCQLRAGEADDGDVAGVSSSNAMWTCACVAPQAEQCAMAGRERVDRLPPAIVSARSRAATADALRPSALCVNVVEQGHGAIPAASRRSGNQVTSAGGR